MIFIPIDAQLSFKQMPLIIFLYRQLLVIKKWIKVHIKWAERGNLYLLIQGIFVAFFI
jgi:hypothetical protein